MQHKPYKHTPKDYNPFHAIPAFLISSYQALIVYKAITLHLYKVQHVHL